MQGKGTFTGPDGTQWTGTFSDNSFQNGTTYHVTGKSFEGTVTAAANANQAKLTFTCPDPDHLFQSITITYTEPFPQKRTQSRIKKPNKMQR